MRRSVMLGTALIVVGGTVFLRELSAPGRYEDPKLGDEPASTQQWNPIVTWATGLSVLAGLALVTTGKRRRI
jgi:hypothetical protein